MTTINIEPTAQLPTPQECENIRTKANLTVTQLGAIVGVSSQSIRYWEKGQRSPQRLQRAAYAKALQQLDNQNKT
jgi:DNA-binding transcriptional regulator YiaG